MPISQHNRDLAKQLADSLGCRILQYRRDSVLLDKEGWFGPQWHHLSECNALADDANREMGLPEGEDWGAK